MNGSPNRRAFLLATAGALGLWQVGCGDDDTPPSTTGQVDGDYQTTHGETVVSLSNGKASITNWKQSKTATMPFTLTGDQITLQGPTGNVVLKRTADGALTGVPKSLSGLPESTVLKKP